MNTPAICPRLFLSLAAVLLLAGLGPIGCSERDTATAVQPSDQPTTAETTPIVPPPYPLETCVVSGEKLGSMGEVYEVQIEGRAIKLCCAGCEDQLQADPAMYLAMLDAPAANVHPHTDGHEHDQHDHH